MDKLAQLETYFTKPENTLAGCSFGDIPIPITFDSSQISIFGVPIDLTATFGKTTLRGPEAIRVTSAKQIETLIYEINSEIYENALIYDLGDITFTPKIKKNQTMDKQQISQFWDYFDSQMSSVLRILFDFKKVPVILGGEHTITYSIFKEFSQYNPLLIHFDAHRDMKSSYDGMDMCHTTPFYHLIDRGFLKGKDIVQIGIRQADKSENDFALKNGVKTFDAWACHNSFSEIINWINLNTFKRNIYISFDIDVYDISYLPCTGTPEPFGLTPFQILDIINSIDKNASILGLDFVETGLRNNDYREGTLATQTLLRLLPRLFPANR